MAAISSLGSPGGFWYGRELSSIYHHTSPKLSAIESPSTSRPLRRHNALGKAVRRTRGPVDYENDLPPTSILRTAQKSGTLSLAPDQVLEFLREFQTQSPVRHPGWERTVCLNHNIDPWTLGIIASILDKCQDPGQRKFGRDLLVTAASFGDRASNFKLVYAATIQGRLHDVTEPLQHVGLLAKSGNDPQAMSLLGMALYSQRKEQEALAWLRKASTGSLEFPGAADALVLEGRILMSHDEAGAMAAFQRAADELDDPNAYFYLSKLLPPESANREAYLTKAAASGVVEASHNLGAIELAKINKGGKKPKALNDYGLARDWTEVAAEGGFGLSMLNMALMCRNVGLREQGLEWLEKAEEDAKVREEAQALGDRWESGETLRG
ncbi:HCP-like protein [Cadophora sp. DSE1049]|nr:HCP-like protein [Cadophora sp. DSE1049]